MTPADARERSLGEGGRRAAGGSAAAGGDGPEDGAGGAAGPRGTGAGPDPRGEALRLLDVPTVLERLAAQATSGAGRRRLRALRPSPRPEVADEALATVDQMVSFLLRFDEWVPPPIPDVERALRRLRAADSMLEGEELRSLATLLGSSRTARAELRREPEELARVARTAEPLPREPELQERIERSIDPNGTVTDAASPRLRELRRSLRTARSELTGRLEGFVRSLPERIQVPDASVTMRNGRYCVAVRREGLSDVGGIVHDESATGQTVYVEPPFIVDPMNRLRELERDERREVERVLRELSEACRRRHDDLSLAFAVLAEVDSLYARGRWALAHGGSRPALARPDAERGAGSWTAALHPLLLGTEEDAIPFDLRMEAGERVLLVSGPNAGGKTVLLKAVGLLSVLAQSGIIPPVGPGTRLPCFRDFFVMIGDEQSIQASLSTFSAHLRGLRRILEEAGGDSLVLVDELGAATDPAEGAALAAAVLRHLAEHAGLTVATTHLGDLKALAAEDPRVVNASLQFDTQALRPTFRLVRDRPGRSYALEMAARLGLPEPVLTDARSRLGRQERAMERVLSGLEDRERELADLVAGRRRAERRLREAEAEADRRARELDRREREAERAARARAEEYLREARAEVEEAIRELRGELERARRQDAGGEGIEEAAEEAFRTARDRVELRIRETRAATPGAPGRAGSPPELSPGDRVRLVDHGVTGEVLEIRDGEVVVAAGGVRLTVPPEDLVEAEGVDEDPKAAGPAPRAGPQVARPEARPEIDIRGVRAEEVEALLLPAVDAAVVADLPRLRVIHGKGTGALRAEVRRLLAADSRVASHRDGGLEEGGGGVTVVEFR